MRSFTALALLAMTGLAACSGTPNRTLESVHQPIVSRTDYVYDMPAPTDHLGAAEAQRLTGWFDSLHLRYGDRVSVDTQGFGPGARDAVGSVAARYGLLLDDNAPVTQGVIEAGSIRVIVSRTNATVPGCPDFSRNNPSEFDGHSNSNYGCATNATFAAMIADSHDLIQGRTGDNSLGLNASGRAIQSYRKGAVKPLDSQSTRSGGQ